MAKITIYANITIGDENFTSVSNYAMNNNISRFFDKDRLSEKALDELK